MPQERRLTTRIRPYADRVVIKPKKAEEVTKTGIVIPDTASQEKPQEGEIIAVGPGKYDESGKRVPVDLKAGDKVIFTKYGPHEIKMDGEEYLIANESDIMAVVS